MTRRNILSIAFCLLTAGAVFAQNKPEHKYFKTSDGVKIHFMVKGKGTPVILIHGYTGSAEGNWFSNGIADALAVNHMVIAIDCRNHGLSDKPQPMGPGKAEDVVELMDHLKIQRAHIHGYSMGGGIVGSLLGMIPDRFITAGFGGSGMNETDAKYRAEAEALDDALPKATGADAEGMERFRARVAAARPAGSPAATPAPAAPPVDLTKLDIPILAVNGSFDNPYRKTHRFWREAKTFQNVILPNKTHLTAISSSGAPPLYIEAMKRFIDAHDAP